MANIRFLTSAADLTGCPPEGKPEIALIGRSNAGKSSFINGLGGSNKLAQVSSAPGKTRLLNFFDVGPSYRLVDMPGYGFSVRSGHEQMSWHTFIEPYLQQRENLAGLLIVMDARRTWTADEQMLVDFMAPRRLPAAVVLTKVDKMSKNEISNAIRGVIEASSIKMVFPTSSLKRSGYDELEEAIFSNWVKPNL